MKSWLLVVFALLLAAPAVAADAGVTYSAQAEQGGFQLLRQGQWSQPTNAIELQTGDVLFADTASKVKVVSNTGERVTLGGQAILWLQPWTSQTAAGNLSLLYGKAQVAADKGQVQVATALGLVRVAPLSEVSLGLSPKVLVLAHAKGRTTLITPTGQRQDLSGQQVGVMAGRIKMVLGQGEALSWPAGELEAPPRGTQQGLSLVDDDALAKLGLLDLQELRDAAPQTTQSWLAYEPHEQFTPQAMQAEEALTGVIWVDDTQDFIARDAFDLTIRKPGEVAKVTVTFEK